MAALILEEAFFMSEKAKRLPNLSIPEANEQEDFEKHSLFTNGPFTGEGQTWFFPYLTRRINLTELNQSNAFVK